MSLHYNAADPAKKAASQTPCAVHVMPHSGTLGPDSRLQWLFVGANASLDTQQVTLNQGQLQHWSPDQPRHVMIKNLLRVLLIAAVLLALAFVGLILLVKPNQFRSAIEQAVLDSTGYQLQIAGDLDLQFRPYIGLTLSDVRLRNPGSPQELASTRSVSLRVDPALLLQRRLLVSELRADNFHINYYTGADGTNIWDLPPGASDSANTSTTRNPVSPEQSAASDTNARKAIDAAFERIVINKASIDIQDLSAGSRYSIDDLNFESRNARLDGQAFPVDLQFMYLANGISEPLPMGLRSNVAIDLTQDQVSLTGLNLNVTPMLLQGELSVTNFRADPQFSGSIESNAFDPFGLLETLGLIGADDALDAPSTSAQSQLSLALQITGDSSRLGIPGLTLTLGNSQLQIDAEVRFATERTPMTVSYNAVSDAVDLTHFLSTPAPDEVEVADTAQTTETDTALPLELLRSLNLLGSIAIGSLTAGDVNLQDINVFTNIEDGVLDIETQPITAYEGTAMGNLRLDARSNRGQLSTHLTLNGLNIAEITPEVSRLNAVTGKLDLEADYNATGSTINELLASLSGSTSFAIPENSVDIGVIKQVFTAIAALGPSGEAIQQWPDIIRFQELAGYILLENGLIDNQQVKVRLDNFDISGTGGINFDARTFNYDLLLTVLGDPSVQTIPIDARYHNISWPVQCSSAFDDSVTQYCRPDFTQVRQIFSEMGASAVRNRLDDTINDQVPDQLQDSARGLLRNLFN